MATGNQGPRDPGIDPSAHHQDLTQQVETLRQQIASMPGYHNLTGGMVTIERRRSRLGALLALMLVAGGIAALLFADSYLLRNQVPARPAQVAIIIAPQQPASDDVLAPIASDTPRPSATPQPTNTVQPTRTPLNTVTPAPSNTPEDTATPAPNDGLRVCAIGNYDKPEVVCTRADQTFREDSFVDARLVMSAPNGGGFRHNDALITLSELNGEGSWSQLGTLHDTVPLDTTRQDQTLAGVFSATNTTPHFDGSRYEVEADSGDVSLGTTTFQLGFDSSSYDQASPTPKDTATPEDTATPVAGVAYAPGNACLGATDATDVVVRFYRALDQQRFEAAYSCFDPSWQAKNPYDGWLAGYAHTLSSRLVLANSLPGNGVWMDLHAVDNTDGREIGRSFTGVWQVSSDLRLLHAKITELRHYAVTDIPDTNFAEVFDFDKRQVIGTQQADVTGDGSTEDIFITRDIGCTDCQKRHVWVFSGGQLVFSATYWHGVDSLDTASDGSGFSVSSPDGQDTFNWTPNGFVRATQ